jgi:O-antigen ligase
MMAGQGRFADTHPLGAAWFFALAVLVLLPGLLFSNFVPAWTPAAALAGLLLLFILRGLAGGRVIGRSAADWPLLLLLISLPLGLWASADRAASLPRVYACLANLAIFWAAAAQRDAAWLRRGGWLLLVGGLALGVVFLLGTNFSRTKLPFVHAEIYSALPGGLRPFWNPGGFNPNLSGGLMALFWPPALVLAWRGESWQQRDAAKLVAVALTALLVLTQSRGALLGCLLALVAITLVRSRLWLPVWLIVALATAMLAYQMGPGVMLEAVLGQSDVFGASSLRGRQELWGQAARLMGEHPVTGVGLGMVEPAIKASYASDLIRPDNNFKHAHNIYLQAGAEMGLPGLLAHLALYGILLYLLARRALDRSAGTMQILALALLGSLIVFLTHGFFEVITYATRAAVVVWGLFGLMAAVATTSVPARPKAGGQAEQPAPPLAAAH